MKRGPLAAAAIVEATAVEAVAVVVVMAAVVDVAVTVDKDETASTSLSIFEKGACSGERLFFVATAAGQAGYEVSCDHSVQPNP